jgi:Subtilase family
MRGVVDCIRQSPQRVVGSMIIALGCLLLISRFLPPMLPTESGDTSASHTPRQRVVIFLVDTTDYFDAHGAYVHSVIRQHCPRCEVQSVNLRGDLSSPSLMQALEHVRLVRHTYDVAVATLVNLSLGTYTYNELLHATVRALDTEGVILIASVGNDNTAKPFYPAAFPEVLGVCSSTRYTKAKAAYSNFGAWVSLCAPGLQYVTRPLQHGELASGTSFASPMVAGVLGQLLLDAPCAPPWAGRQALLRTAAPMAAEQSQLGAGLLNPTAAGQYLHSLYACENPNPLWYRMLRYVTRLGTSIGVSLGLMVYFFLSVFTIPFLLAFVIETVQRRAEQRQQQAIQRAYTGSPAYRCQRLLAIQRDCLHWHKVRQRYQAELFALLHALWVHGEPCWWCGRPEAEPMVDTTSTEAATVCSRCGMEPYVLSSPSPQER